MATAAVPARTQCLTRAHSRRNRAVSSSFASTCIPLSRAFRTAVRVDRVARERDAASRDGARTTGLCARSLKRIVRARASEGVIERGGPSEPTATTQPWFDRFLKLPSDGSEIWEAKWGMKVIIQVMVLWFCAFCVIGNAVFPYAAGVLGFDTSSFTQRGLATYSLCLDFTQMLMTWFVLRQSLRPFRPFGVNWFPVRWFEDRKYLRDVAVACVAFPFVVWLHGLSTTLLEHIGLIAFDETVTAAWEQSMKSNDIISKAFYMLLASFAAPVWEELIFRGFFFASLTAFTGAARAMLISSTLFACAHFSLEQFLPLTFLGCLMCVVFVRTRNLLAPVLVHSAWNAWVLAGDFLPPLDVVLRAVFAAAP